jgi:carbon monoxide dehydrogenase subunit G
VSATFVASVDVAVPVERVWARMTDWPAHSRWIPFTTVKIISGDGVGQRFVGRTGIGPVGFDDPMEIVDWRPPRGDQPGFCRVHKYGRVVLGDAWFEVAGRAGGSRVTWTEEVELAPLRALRLSAVTAPLIRGAGRPAFTRSLRTMAAELESEAP